MTLDDPVPVEVSSQPPLDDTLVRNAVEEVKESARIARRLEVWLVVAACLLMVTVAGFTGYNTYRLRDVNRNLTVLAEAIEANQVAQQAYNEAHAESSGHNFTALIENIRCFTSFFEMTARPGSPPDKAVLDACFKPPTPTPPPAKLPSEDPKKK